MSFLRQLLGKAPAIKITPEENPQLYTLARIGQLIQENNISGASIRLHCDAEGIKVIFNENRTNNLEKRIPVGDDPVWSGKEKPALSIRYLPGSDFFGGKWQVIGYFSESEDTACSWPLRWAGDAEFKFEDTKPLAEMMKQFSTASLWELTDFYRQPDTASQEETVEAFAFLPGN